MTNAEVLDRYGFSQCLSCHAEMHETNLRDDGICTWCHLTFDGDIVSGTELA